MILFTFSLIFVLNSASIPACAIQAEKDGGIIDGCYVYATHEIYVNKETTFKPQDFVLYHEIGHHIFTTNYDKGLFSDNEVMADQFALFIYEHKYPYLKGIERTDREEYFSQYCNENCIENILSIKLPNSHFNKAFSVRD